MQCVFMRVLVFFLFKVVCVCFIQQFCFVYKEFKFGVEGCVVFFQGVEIFVKVVVIIFGFKGCNVFIEFSFGFFKIIKGEFVFVL